MCFLGPFEITHNKTCTTLFNDLFIMYLLSLFDLFVLTVQSCSLCTDFLFHQARMLWNNFSYFSYVLYLHFSVVFECGYIFASSLLPEKFDKKSNKIILSFFSYILSVFNGKNTAHAQLRSCTLPECHKIKAVGNQRNAAEKQANANLSFSSN